MAVQGSKSVHHVTNGAKQENNTEGNNKGKHYRNIIDTHQQGYNSSQGLSVIYLNANKDTFGPCRIDSVLYS